MKKLLNTLFVTTHGAYLSRKGETVLVQVDGESRLRVPIHTIDGIVCFGRINCSTPLMHLCGERNVTLSFMSEHGRFQARVQGPVSGNVLLRREQYRRADDHVIRSEIARSLVTAKVANSRTVLSRTLRDHRSEIDAATVEHAIVRLAHVAEALSKPLDLDSIRGREGEAARIYFGTFDHLIVAQKDEFFFRERSRRPPLDKMNALLSFLYSVFTHDMVSSLEGVGLDTAVGYLHADRPGRPGLALDLMEEFRAFFLDRLALSLVNRRQVKAKRFKTTETGAVRMDDKTRKAVLTAYQKRKQDEIRHPFLDEKVPIGLLPHCQALLFSRYLRGDIDGYPPFLWR